MSTLNILLCGARGFVGRNIKAALIIEGHTIFEAKADFSKDTSPEVWIARLENIDVVINAVGVLRDSQSRPLKAVHSDTPKALFDACATVSQMRATPIRVIQISALGVGSTALDNPTDYAATKREADIHLLSLIKEGRLSGTVLRPSIIFGAGGASSKMFVALSKLPVLVLPKPVLSAQVQPIAVQDLARGVASLLKHSKIDAMYECVGTSALPLADFIASLREQQGRTTARILVLPAWMTRLSARLGDYVPFSPWCSETLALLALDNVSASSAFASILGNTQLPLSHYWSQAWLSPEKDK